MRVKRRSSAAWFSTEALFVSSMRAMASVRLSMRVKRGAVMVNVKPTMVSIVPPICSMRVVRMVSRCSPCSGVRGSGISVRLTAIRGRVTPTDARFKPLH